MSSESGGDDDASQNEHAPLSHYVATCLDHYFDNLNGEQPSGLYRLVLEQVEEPLLCAVMSYCGGNQTKAAETLGLNRGTLRKKLRQHGLE